MPTTPLTRVELSAKHEDAEWRDKFADLLSLVTLLRECVIENNYRPSEELNAAIALSDSGRKVSTQLTTQEKVNAKDAHVLALIGLVHIEPLIDVDGIDLDRLERAISDEVLQGALRFPLIWGRELYDRASDLFKEERDYLNHADTLRLLEGMPQGVFQAGRYLVGPYGVVRRDYSRRIGPTTAVPIQHCADPGCKGVHRVQLTTSIEAGVNRGRPALSKLLSAISEEPSDWNGFYSDITDGIRNGFEVTNDSAIEMLIGDAFSDEELALLLCHAADLWPKEVRGDLSTVGLADNPKSVATKLNRAELLQVLFMRDNGDLATLVDSALRERLIVVPGDEVRRARVNAGVAAGSWRLKSQLSRLGVRAIGNDPALPLLRLSALARSIFDAEDLQDMEELSWILRSVGRQNASEKLEEYLRTSSPAEIVQNLLLARRSNAARVCDDLGIDISQDDVALRDSILWKLGFPLPRSTDTRDEYWQSHANLESLARTAAVDVGATAEGLRQASSDYFVLLERFLFDSLCFASWCLLHDHYADPNPFVFTEKAARELTIRELNASEANVDREALSDEPVLSAVVQGFNRLSRLLDSLKGKTDEFSRDPQSYPKWSKKTDLQRFPFVHTRSFLDLTPESQAQIVTSLAAVGSGLNDSGIMTARNGLLHAKQRVPTVGEVEDALRGARQALDALEQIGCVRSTYSFASAQSNAWGGGTTVMSSNGRTVSFSDPSAFEWLGLPPFSRPHYLVLGAVFAGHNEMLRFSEGFDSQFQDYWDGYPKRPEPGNRIASSQSETLSNNSEAGAYTSSRVG